MVTWCLHPLVVVGIDADLVLLKVEGELTSLDCPQFMMAVQVRPPPQAAIDDVGEALAVGYLQTAVQRPGKSGGGGRKERKEQKMSRERERRRMKTTHLATGI